MLSTFRNIRIRTRVLLALFLPLMGLVGMSGYVLLERFETARDMAQVEAVAELATRISSVVHELQRERGLSATYLSSHGTKMADALADQRRTVDAARGRLQEFLTAFETEGLSTAFASRLSLSLEDLAKLDATRQQVAALNISAADAIGDFAATISSLLEVVSGVALVSKDAAVSNVIPAYVGLMAAKEKAGLERARGAVGISSGAFDQSLYLSFVETVAEQETYLQVFETYASDDIRDYSDSTVLGRPVEEVERIRALIHDGGPGASLGDVEGAYWFDMTTARIDLLKAVEDRIAEKLGRVAASVHDRALLALYAIGAVVCLLLGATVVTGLLGIRSIAGPIVAMTAMMRKLADGDKTVTIPATDREDEVGQMAGAVVVFRDNMIKAEELAAKEAEAQRIREARAQTVEQLTGDFDKAVSDTLKTVASAATELQSTAGAMSATAEQTNRQAGNVAAASEQASINVQTVASAAEELSASITEISRQVAQSAEIAGKAVTDAERTNIQVQGLAEAAQKIGEVVSLINDIASQTNLLALNATIEAARAGDAGKGFAVVASEVKSLANETARATEEITAQITGVQAATREAVSAIQAIGQTIGSINEIATTIASAVEEQGAATQEIARNVQQASAGTREVSSNITGVTQAATETGAAANQVLGASGELSRPAEALRRQVERFLAGVRAA